MAAKEDAILTLSNIIEVLYVTTKTKKADFFDYIFADHITELDRKLYPDVAFWNNIYNGKKGGVELRKQIAQKLCNAENIDIILAIQNTVLSGIEKHTIPSDYTIISSVKEYVKRLPEAEADIYENYNANKRYSRLPIEKEDLANLLDYVLANLDSALTDQQQKNKYFSIALTYLCLGALLRNSISFLHKYYSNTDTSVELLETKVIGNKHIDFLHQKLVQQETQHNYSLKETLEPELYPSGIIRNSTNTVPDAPISLGNFLKTHWQTTTPCHLFIQGIGGIGKTTALFHYTLDPEVNTNHIPVVFIPLNALDGIIADTKFYRNIEWYLKAYYSQEYKYILNLANHYWIYHPNIIIILDGLNEVSNDTYAAVIKDITEWSGKRGVQLIITSRSGFDFSNTFITFELIPLSQNMIFHFLEKKQRNATQFNIALLNTPFLLQLYLYATNTRSKWLIPSMPFTYWKETISSESDLIWNYMQAELTHCINENHSNITASEFAYAILVMAPYLFWQMTQNHTFSIDTDTLQSWIVEGDTSLRTSLPHMPKQLNRLIWDTGCPIEFNTLHVLTQFEIFTKQNIFFRKNINTVTNETYYLPQHQNFRDALAAIHIFNLLEYYLSEQPSNLGDFSNEILKTRNYDVLKYLVYFLSESQLTDLWNTNRNLHPTHVFQTKWLLHLFGIRFHSNFSSLNFSEMNLENVNLTNCKNTSSTRLTLPTASSEKFENTRISETTFSPNGHTSMVNNVVVYQNGHRCVSASSDHTLRIWDLDAYECIGILNGHENGLRALAVYPYGNVFRCISGSYDGSIYIWDLSEDELGGFVTHTPLLKLCSHNTAINTFAIYDNGHRCISASSDGTLVIWNLDTGKPVFSPFMAQAGPVNIVKIFADEKKCISGHANNTLFIWDLTNGQLLYGPLTPKPNISLKREENSHNYIASSADSPLSVWKVHTFGMNDIDIYQEKHYTKCVAVSSDNSVSVWNLNTGKQISKTLFKHSKGVNAVKIYDNGNKCVTGSDDGTLVVWDLNTCEMIGKPLESHKDWIIRLDTYLSEGTHYCVSASFDNTLKIWDLDNHLLLDTLTGHTDWVQGIQIFPSASLHFCVSASADCSVRVWNLTERKLIKTMSGCSKLIRAIDSYYTEGNPRCITASSDGILRIWDLNCYKCIGILEGHSAWANAVKVYDNGKYCISAASDHTLRVWELKTKRCVYILKGHNDWVIDVDVFRKGNVFFAVSASFDKTLRLWNLSTGRNVGSSLCGHQAGVKTVKVYDNGHRAISGSYDHTLQIWDLDTLSPLGTPLVGHEEWIRDLDVYQKGDSTLCLSASSDKTFALWDLSHKKCIGRTVHGNHASINAIHFLNGGEKCIFATNDGMIKIWDLRQFTIAESHIIIKSHSRINGLCTYGDSLCAVVSDDGIMRIFKLTTGVLVKEIDVMHGASVVGIDLSQAIFDKEDTKKYLCDNGAIV